VTAKAIPFVKMQGCGNDYVYVDGFHHQVDDPVALAKAVSDRRFGIGSDGLILILPSDKADVRMRMWNADGSESEMCGNGIRCVAKLAYERGLAPKKARLTAETGAGVLGLDLTVTNGSVEAVTVDMGEPRLERAEIPMVGAPGRVVDEELRAGDRAFRVTCVSMGNPHCVTYVDDVKAFPVERYGPLIETHLGFPRRTNVEFVQVVSRGEVIQRTWERGAGETWACGTGASAVGVAGVLTGRTDRAILVHLRGGDLHIAWPEGQGVRKTGPAVVVFEGSWPGPGGTPAGAR
jgi:diaminopimelate epimerase